MIKRVSLVRRRTDLSADDFHAHWTGPHAAIVRQLPGLRGLRFGRVIRQSPDAVPWDGIGEVWFDSVADAERAFATQPFLDQLIADRARFIGAAAWCFVEEHTAVPPPAGEAQP